jgi:hypothetical protein
VIRIAIPSDGPPEAVARLSATVAACVDETSTMAAGGGHPVSGLLPIARLTAG